jgi:hypothetical protein
LRQIAGSIRSRLSHRTPGASICPSEIARLLAPQAWRALMPVVRAVAARMAQDGEVRITQGDRELDPHRLPGGPIRLRRGPNWPH